MDNRKNSSNPNPRDRANIFSVLTWTWTIGLFKTGYNKILGVEDLYDPVNKDRSNALGDRLENQWFLELERAKRKKHSPSFSWAIYRTFAPEIILLGFIQIINEVALRLGTSFFMGALLKYFKLASDMPYEIAIYYATGMVAATFVTAILLNQTFFIGYHVGGRIRIAACSVIYRKALRLNKNAIGETASGKIVNLIASDVNRFEVIFTLVHHMWSAPLSAIIITILLYFEVGWSTFVGMNIVFLVVPFQGYLGKLTSKYRLQTSLRTDERVHLMDEIISGIQVIKMYAWENAFCALVELARRLELKIVKKSSYIRGIYMTFSLFTTRMAVYGILVTMLLRGQELTAEKVFVYMSYFNLISVTMSSIFVRGVTEIAECTVAVKRIQRFLMYEESRNTNKNDLPTSILENVGNISRRVKNDIAKTNGNTIENIIMRPTDLLTDNLGRQNHSNNSNVSDNENWPIEMEHVTAKWDSCSTEKTLDDINVKIAKGKLHIVIGTVGSGKSSFISTILGELKLLQGSIEVKGRISYADQDAWIFGASVRQNILFGQKYNRERYTKVIKVCALHRDFQEFPQGDQTYVGERGNSLSGGQKARINLARAVYRRADIYLLDDPLSAVDAHVGKYLFKECFQNCLKGKTLVLVTHQLQYIKDADAILLLNRGKLSEYANYHELLQAFPEYNSLITAENEKECVEETLQYVHGERRFSVSSTRSRLSEIEMKTDGENNVETRHDAFFEGTSRGTVKGSLFLKYVRSGASAIDVFLVMMLYIVTQVCVSLCDYFIHVLVNAEESRKYYERLHKTSSFPVTQNNTVGFLEKANILSRDHYIYIYTGLVASIFIVGITRTFFFYKMCLQASQRLHDLAFAALIRATMLFFNTNPSGRILNRFSKDLGTIDELLPRAMLDAVQIILTLFGAVVVTCIVNVWFIVPAILIGALFWLIRRIYLKTSKNIKRLEGMTRSPVFTHLNATLNGITTIRAYQAENILKEEFDKLQDTHTSSWYMFIATSIAFGFSLDMCTFIFTGVTTFSFLLLKDSFTSSAVGLVITQVLFLTGLLQWGMRQSAEITNHLMSVERVIEYSQLTSEPNFGGKGIIVREKKSIKTQQAGIPLVDPAEDWPSTGGIEFKNVFMHYSDNDPPIIKNLTLMIRPSEKVGIVGRTGAGKSSLISALFRLVKVEGVIEIDGLDTGTIALEDLRKNISIIPQDPVLFSGTLRRNLDPFNELTDERLCEVLEEVELKDSVKLTGDGLDHRVLDRGSNYSTGQRQLICLARAILRNNRILMLDEATANVDPHTDALIQRTIRTKFASCTVLTIAHRLHTIMDSDKVLVMEKGCAVEFDHPYILLLKENGPFSSLVKETGKTMYEQLYKIAQDSYVAKYANP